MGKISSAVILAAGYSTRLGQPKALVMWNEETLIERSIRLLEDAGIKKIVVVTNKELMADFIPLVGNHSIVVNPSPENGRTGSLQIGIKSILSNLPNIPRAILVVPVDRCGWESGTVQALLSQKNLINKKKKAMSADGTGATDSKSGENVDADGQPTKKGRHHVTFAD